MTKHVSLSQFRKLALRFNHLQLIKHDFDDGFSRLVLCDYDHKDCLYVTPKLSRKVADYVYSYMFFLL